MENRMDTVDVTLMDLFKLAKAHVQPATETLVDAFQSYPLVQHYFPHGEKRDKVTQYFLSFAVYNGIRYGEVYSVSPNCEGVAIWMPPGTYPLTFWRVLRSVPLSVLLSFARYGGGEMRDVGEYIEKVHQRLTPFKHWFLQTIGVAPQFQGKGYAGMLLRAMLAKIDEEGLPCYLETLEEKNVSLYEHFGFRIVDKSDIPETGLTNWAMLRE
jgi:ribosomal protein S18 acetylase RimI-like enzyme